MEKIALVDLLRAEIRKNEPGFDKEAAGMLGAIGKGIWGAGKALMAPGVAAKGLGTAGSILATGADLAGTGALLGGGVAAGRAMLGSKWLSRGKTGVRTFLGGMRSSPAQGVGLRQRGTKAFQTSEKYLREASRQKANLKNLEGGGRIREFRRGKATKKQLRAEDMSEFYKKKGRTFERQSKAHIAADPEGYAKRVKDLAGGQDPLLPQYQTKVRKKKSVPPKGAGTTPTPPPSPVPVAQGAAAAPVSGRLGATQQAARQQAAPPPGRTQTPPAQQQGAKVSDADARKQNAAFLRDEQPPPPKGDQPKTGGDNVTPGPGSPVQDAAAASTPPPDSYFNRVKAGWGNIGKYITGQGPKPWDQPGTMAALGSVPLGMAAAGAAGPILSLPYRAANSLVGSVTGQPKYQVVNGQMVKVGMTNVSPSPPGMPGIRGPIGAGGATAPAGIMSGKPKTTAGTSANPQLWRGASPSTANVMAPGVTTPGLK